MKKRRDTLAPWAQIALWVVLPAVIALAVVVILKDVPTHHIFEVPLPRLEEDR